MSRLAKAAAMVGLVSLWAACPLQAEQDKKRNEVFTANVLRQMGGPATGSGGRLKIVVEDWTTPEERGKLAAALKEGGSEAAKKLLDKMDKGSISYPATLGWRLNHAVSFQTEQGRLIRLATVRPITLREVRRSTRSRDYEFGVIEILLDKDGKGEGTLIPAAKINLRKDGEMASIEIETLPNTTGVQRLLNVRTKQ